MHFITVLFPHYRVSSLVRLRNDPSPGKPCQGKPDALPLDVCSADAYTADATRLIVEILRGISHEEVAYSV